MPLHEATQSMVQLKHEMIQKINDAIRDFEQQTALVVSSLSVNMERRHLQAKFAATYPPALAIDDVEIKLLEL
jgi:hypothetical protein